jgi:hypothetical protein
VDTHFTQNPIGEPVMTDCSGDLPGASVRWERCFVDGQVAAPAGKPALLLGGKTPIVIGHEAGKGRTVFLNLSLGKVLANYAGDAATRKFMLAILERGGVAARLQVPPGYLVTMFQDNGYELLSCRISTDGKDGERLGLGRAYQVYDVRTGKDLGFVGELVPSACSGRNNLFALLPAPTSDLQVAFPKAIKAGNIVRVNLAQKPENGRCTPERLSRLQVFGPDKREIEAMRAFATLGAQPMSVELPLALNSPAGPYVLEATDLLTGMKQTSPLSVKGEGK